MFDLFFYRTQNGDRTHVVRLKNMCSIHLVVDRTIFFDAPECSAKWSNVGSGLGKFSIDKNNLDKLLTIGVKTFGRTQLVLRLIRSVRDFYPTVPIIVADDGARDEMRAYEDIIDVRYFRLMEQF